MNLLSVDFDFSFPLPSASNKHFLLYDWGHRESSFFLSRGIWEIRAAGFLHDKLPLPGIDDKTMETFWESFTILPGSPIYISESHVRILQILNDYDCVVNFDAHHDCGYSYGTHFNPNEIDCGEWGIVARLKRLRYELVYPTWRRKVPEGRVPKRYVDNVSYYDKVRKQVPSVCYNFVRNSKLHSGLPIFEGVFICRSGAWLPAWLDDTFVQFVKDFRAKFPTCKLHYLEPRPKHRGFRIRQARNHAAITAGIMKATKEKGR